MFAEVGYLLPDRLNQLNWALCVIVPDEFVYLLAVLIILDELDDRSSGQLGAMLLLAYAEYSKVCKSVPLSKLVMIQ